MTSWELKQHKANRENKKRGEEVANSLSKMVNVLGGNREAEQAFIDEVTNDHRTLQQSTGGLFIKVFSAWADQADKGFYDGRNEALVMFAKKLRDENPDAFKYGFPMI